MRRFSPSAALFRGSGPAEAHTTEPLQDCRHYRENKAAMKAAQEAAEVAASEKAAQEAKEHKDGVMRIGRAMGDAAWFGGMVRRRSSCRRARRPHAHVRPRTAEANATHPRAPHAPDRGLCRWLTARHVVVQLIKHLPKAEEPEKSFKQVLRSPQTAGVASPLHALCRAVLVNRAVVVVLIVVISGEVPARRRCGVSVVAVLVCEWQRQSGDVAARNPPRVFGSGSPTYPCGVLSRTWQNLVHRLSAGMDQSNNIRK